MVLGDASDLWISAGANSSFLSDLVATEVFVTRSTPISGLSEAGIDKWVMMEMRQ